MNKNIAIGILVAIIVALGIVLIVRTKTSQSSSLNGDSSTPQTATSSSDQSVNSGTVQVGTPATVPCTAPDCQSSSQVNAQSTNTVITQPSWGISLVNPSGWKAVINDHEVALTETTGQWADVMTVDYISGSQITDVDAKYGTVTYFYDASSKSWMKIGQVGDADTAIGTSAHPVPATVLSKTADGLLVLPGTGTWLTYIVPLSSNKFLKLNIGGSGQTQPLKDLLATIKKI